MVLTSAHLCLQVQKDSAARGYNAGLGPVSVTEVTIKYTYATTTLEVSAKSETDYDGVYNVESLYCWGFAGR
jgi:hypothetical protein